MLASIGVFDEDERKAIAGALKELHRLDRDGSFLLDATQEDVHSNIEFWLVETQDIAAGKKIHAGRSRNDQVATDLRLLARDRIIAYGLSCSRLVECMVRKARPLADCPMPGFTHHQPAMWCTFAYWIASWIEALLRSLKRLETVFETVNLCPLGSAAGFGTGWSVNREMTSELLGFSAPTRNCLDGILSRTELETEIASAYSLLMHRFADIAQDLILLSHPYFGMIRLDDRYVTGSSIMPQKKNPDFAEVIKGKAAFSSGTLSTFLEVQKGSFSGYNRDVQVGKYALLDLFREAENIPEILTGVVETLEVDREAMSRKCLQGFMHGSDLADWLAKERGLSFRDAYHVLERAVRYSGNRGMIDFHSLRLSLDETHPDTDLGNADLEIFNHPLQTLKLRSHTGSPHPEKVLETLAEQSKLNSRFVENFQAKRRAVEESAKKLLLD